MNRPKRILTIFGTRPEAIKLAPVIAELRRRKGSFECSVCVTAQHRELLDQALEPFGIAPDFDLALMQNGQTLAQITARAVQRLDEVLSEALPDLVLVQGDTTSALCGALVAYYHQIPVGHVEAGLRSGRKYAPFPEEVNRCLVTRLADLHFAPTPYARQALVNEGVPHGSVFVTGNTVIDALNWMRERVRSNPPVLDPDLMQAMDGRLVALVTGHRRESFGEGFENICLAIRAAAEACPDAAFVYPVHLNPRVREPALRILGTVPRVKLIEPLPYGAFVWLMDRADVVLTDSGGVQEEAPSLGKPVLVMREVTERPEGIEAGASRLVGVTAAGIADALIELLLDSSARAAMSIVVNPYGDGRASERIVDVLGSL